MLNIESIEDISLLRETATLECKLAGGRDGKGKLPGDFWPTYSSFANTYGGTILLGIKEDKNGFHLVGVADVTKVRTDLFNDLNNQQKVSSNLLSDKSVSEIVLDGKTIVRIDVPRAVRQQKPVHLTPNPFAGNTFRRLNESDVSLSDDEVRRMLSERVDDSRDSRVLGSFNFDDLSMDTFRSYRQVFANRDPDHPWNAKDDREFLRSIGGWRRDRETDATGLTVAGLVMFGTIQSIQDEFPNFMLDYQERPEAKTENRWIDRLTLDGKWSGNLYDFYRRVYLKLTAEIKVPFALEDAERQDETIVHTALREALANALVHSDFTERASILIVKRPDMFGFRNPGLMRIAVDVALKGGESDCRNRTLAQMFRFVGVGEQAGSGIPKIMQGWESQHWKPPLLHETTIPFNQTLLELRMADLFPAETVEGLRRVFGPKFDGLTHVARVALSLAASEGTVNHSRLCSMSTDHPVELSRTLHGLVQDGYLETSGTGRGVVYFLPGQSIPSPEDIFPNAVSVGVSGARSSNVGSLSTNLGSSSLHSEGGSLHNGNNRGSEGYLTHENLPLPMIDNLDKLEDTIRHDLQALAVEPRTKRRIERIVMEGVLQDVCKGHFLTLNALSALLERNPESLRNQYLSPMVKDGRIKMAFPKTPTHEQQAYCTASSIPNG